MSRCPSCGRTEQQYNTLGRPECPADCRRCYLCGETFPKGQYTWVRDTNNVGAPMCAPCRILWKAGVSEAQP